MKTIEVAAIDIGTTKICTLIAIPDGGPGWRILGVGIAPNRGLEKGLVMDIAGVEESVRQSVKSAEVMAGCRVVSACINVTGRNLSSVNSQATVAITHKNQVVRLDDVGRALRIAMDMPLPDDRQWLQVIPRNYTLDGLRVAGPVGLSGLELSLEAHLVTADKAPLQNLRKCVTNAGIKIDDIIPGSWASAAAVLSEAEKQSGVLIVDVGAGCLDAAVIRGGGFYHTSALPSAGHWITAEIAAGLGIPLDLAEEIKKKYGRIIQAEDATDLEISVGKNGSRISRPELDHIIHSRVEALFHLILLDLQVFTLPQVGYGELIPAGMVITGGGANLPGICELGQRVSRLPVRAGIPPGLGNICESRLDDPAYATSLGLLLWQIQHRGLVKWLSSEVRVLSG